MAEPVLLMLSGPSGVGKTTVARRLLEENPSLDRVITCTTRSPREGEVDGVDYHFLDEQEFVGRIKSGRFIEHAEVYGNRYGTMIEGLRSRLDAGLDVLLVNDVQGAESVCKLARTNAQLEKALVTVYLVTDGVDELRRRLIERGLDDASIIDERLQTAEAEIARASEFDFTVISRSRDKDWRKVQEIYMAERRL